VAAVFVSCLVKSRSDRRSRSASVARSRQRSCVSFGSLARSYSSGRLLAVLVEAFAVVGEHRHHYRRSRTYAPTKAPVA
jgi:hypothetical protein